MLDTNFTEKHSSLISRIVYDDNEVLIIYFRRYYVESYTYFDVPSSVLEAMFASKSIGKFYLTNIKNNYLTKQKQDKMADKVIKMSIDVKKINKDWLFPGEKGTYLSVTLLYNEEQDQYGNNGMLLQDVPKKIYEAEKNLDASRKTKSVILGNGKVFSNEPSNREGQPGKEGSAMGVDEDDDLPF